jgi:peptidoglycan/LPS O-acetylase OafA/YrhL
MSGYDSPVPSARAPNIPKRIDVQGIRGVAVLLVVLFHAGLPLTGGFVGVDVFFVVSGFVITRLLWSELMATGTLRLRLFYARRARRLLPALALVLLVVAAAALLIYTPLGLLQQTAMTGAAAALFSANAVIFLTSGGYFDAASTDNPLLHTWTLAVEEQFYLFFPWVLLIGWNLRARLRAERSRLLVVPVLVLAVLAASFALSCFLTYGKGGPFGYDHNHSFAFYSSPTRAWEFAAGALLALTEPDLRRLGPAAAQVAGLLGLGLLAAATVLISGNTPFPGLAALLPVLATVCLITAGSTHVNIASSVLSLGWLTWLGDVSYSWYLWHWPALVFARVIVPDASLVLTSAVAALSVVPAWLSYRLVEDRVRRNKAIVGWRAVRVAAVSSLIPIVAFAGIAFAARHPSSQMRDFQAQQQPHLDFTHDCIHDLPGTQAARKCEWSVPGSKGTIILLGDSNAGHFAEPVRGVARADGYDFQLATSGGCPFSALQVRYGILFDADRCNTFRQAWIDYVQQSRPALVVLASDSAAYLQPDSGVWFVHPRTGEQLESARDKARAWKDGIEELVKRWSRVGVPVLVVHPVPEFAHFDLRECPTFRVYEDRSACGRTARTATLAAETARAYGAEDQAVRGWPLAATLNLFHIICPGRRCSTYRDGEFLYRDQAHLSVPFALSLEPTFAKAMKGLLRH